MDGTGTSRQMKRKEKWKYYREGRDKEPRRYGNIRPQWTREKRI